MITLYSILIIISVAMLIKCIKDDLFVPICFWSVVLVLCTSALYKKIEQKKVNKTEISLEEEA